MKRTFTIEELKEKAKKYAATTAIPYNAEAFLTSDVGFLSWLEQETNDCEPQKSVEVTEEELVDLLRFQIDFYLLQVAKGTSRTSAFETSTSAIAGLTVANKELFLKQVRIRLANIKPEYPKDGPNGVVFKSEADEFRYDNGAF